MKANSAHMNGWTLGAALLLGVTLAGCTKYTDYDDFVRDPRPAVTSTDYRMGPPDVVLISSKRVREIHNHTEMIRPDGKLTLPLLGSVYVAGKTPEEASAELEELAREFYEDADASLRVTHYNSKKIYVFGEVSGPGPYAYDGANTILETLAFAQPTRLADPERIPRRRPASGLPPATATRMRSAGGIASVIRMTITKPGGGATPASGNRTPRTPRTIG